jgi:hypothetical protein
MKDQEEQVECTFLCGPLTTLHMCLGTLLIKRVGFRLGEGCHQALCYRVLVILQGSFTHPKWESVVEN